MLEYNTTQKSILAGSHGLAPEACKKSDLDFETICSHGFQAFDEKTGAIGTPIIQTATFRHPSLGESTGFDYSRGPQPTRLELEKTVALLEHAEYALAFSSGMAAIACFLKKFRTGDEIVVSDDLYGGTWRIFKLYEENYGLKVIYVDTSDFENNKSFVTENTKLVYLETPSNPMMKISDIKKWADLIHSFGGILAVDNTFLTPYYQKPIDDGADFVIHSASKYLEGHNDTVAGLLVYNKKENDEYFRMAQMAEGACLGPFDSWLVLRGIKTLSVRMDKTTENAKKIVEFLSSNKNIEKVFYAGLGGMISFYVKDAKKVPDILKNLKVIIFAESLGGVQSLMTYPETQTHNAIPVEIRNKVGVNDKLLRLSVGIESSEDLIKDLKQSLEA